MSDVTNSSSNTANVQPSGKSETTDQLRTYNGGAGVASTPATAGMPKEQEPLPQGEVPLEEISTEVELEPGLEAIGVEKKSETITLPEDVKKMGVQAVGPSQPVTQTTAVPLPLTDDQIVIGLHAQIISSLRWLAEWCIRQLKKAHLHLKTIAGHAVRERDT